MSVDCINKPGTGVHGMYTSRKQSRRGAGKEAKEVIGWLVCLFDNNVEMME